MGKAHYFIFSGDVLGSIHIDFADFNILALFGKFIQDWGEHEAGRTPVRPEIDNNPSIRLQYLSFKIFFKSFRSKTLLKFASH